MKAYINALNKKYLIEFKTNDEFINFCTKFNDNIQHIKVLKENETVKTPPIHKSEGWKELDKNLINKFSKEHNNENDSSKLGGNNSEFKYDSNKSLNKSKKCNKKCLDNNCKNKLNKLKEGIKDYTNHKKPNKLDFLNSSEYQNILDHIANLVLEGYTSGFDPTWSIEITPNTNGFSDNEYNEDAELIEISRLIKEGYTSGFDPTWELNIELDSFYEQYAPKNKSKKLKEGIKDSTNSQKYYYMLLDRLRSDCEYFLHNGNGYEKHLWAGNIDDQISKMKEIYNILKVKPEWLTMNDINLYYKKMKNYSLKNKNDNNELKEGIKDYLPRAGFIHSDENDKESRKVGGYFAQGTDDQLKKARIIAKVKLARGERFGRVTKEDLDNFDEYYQEYQDYYGDNTLREFFDFSSVYKDSGGGKEFDFNNVDYDQILKRYSEEYDRLYNGEYDGNDYYEALDYFDNMMKDCEDFKQFVRDIVKYRGDVFSSDRECVALMFAFSSLGIIEKFNQMCGNKINENFSDGMKKVGKFAKNTAIGLALLNSILSGNVAYGDITPEQRKELEETIDYVEEDGTVHTKYGYIFSPDEWDMLLHGEDPYYDGLTHPL